jgi:filamentous hemagglutinin family protein
VKAKSNRSYQNLLFCLLSISVITLGSNILPAQSQIVPDDTLDEESSRVTPDIEINDVKSDRIDGGATRGTNLFHSLSEFNVGEGQGAYFTNPAGIENILGRVTGGNPSEILGRLGVTGGDANLFLINPNGIIFGANSSLDVGGSFVGTTANGIGLGEDGSFNATEPQTSNLLSVNPSALFFNAVAAQSIVNRSQAESLSGETNSLGEPVGLQVPEGKSLALVGGDVSLEGENSVGGNLTATGGRIELGSVAGVGEVSLNQSGDDLLLGYEDVKAFGDIMLEGAVVKASGGSSTIEAKNLIVHDGAQVITNVLGEEDGGILSVNTTGSIELIGTTKDGQFSTGLFASTQGSGDAGNLMISTGSLIVRDGALVITATSSEGEGGDLNINATESIELIGTTKDGQIPSALFAGTGGSGDAGNLTISTGNLIVRDGAVVSTATLGNLIVRIGNLIVRDGALVITATSSKGEGGDLNINATESIELIGTTKDGQFSTGLFTSTEGSGDAGNLTISTGNLIIRDGAQISTGTFSEGNGGDLNISASESIKLIGTGISKNLQFSSGLLTESLGSGDAGNLTIETRSLIVDDGAQIFTGAFTGNLDTSISELIKSIGTSTQTEEGGDAGNLTITTESLIVREAGISSISDRSSGGEISIFANSIRLKGNSFIFSSVFSGAGDGGDINLTADSIIAFNDSDIIAAASDGSGGNINLDTPAFFGDGYQDSSLNTNQNSLDGNNRVDINATGAFNGIITFPDVSFIQNNLATLPQVFLNTNDLIASSCIARRDRQTGSFTITGNDSLPTPGQSDDAAYPTGTVQTIPSPSFDDSDSRPWKKGDPIIEPTGVYRLPNGELVMSRECSQ